MTGTQTTKPPPIDQLPDTPFKHLLDVAEGDWVIVRPMHAYEPFCGFPEHRYARVARTTTASIYTEDGTRYSRTTGKKHGHGGDDWRYESIEAATQNRIRVTERNRARHRRHAAEVARRRAVASLDALSKLLKDASSPEAINSLASDLDRLADTFKTIRYWHQPARNTEDA